jgi:hypothetical protein
MDLIIIWALIVLAVFGFPIVIGWVSRIPPWDGMGDDR